LAHPVAEGKRRLIKSCADASIEPGSIDVCAGGSPNGFVIAGKPNVG
jgi:hypothetical protein